MIKKRILLIKQNNIIKINIFKINIHNSTMKHLLITESVTKIIKINL